MIQEFFDALLSIVGFIFSDDIKFFGTIPLWTLLVGATIFIALTKFLKGKGSGS